MSLKFLMIFAACIAMAACDSYPTCGGGGVLNNVLIEGCTPDKPCILTKGTTKAIEIDFTPSSATSTLTMGVYGVIGGIPIPFPGFDTDGCQAKYNVQCPLAAQTQYQYKNAIVIQESYPSMSVTVEWDGVADDGEEIFCFTFDAKIV